MCSTSPRGVLTEYEKRNRQATIAALRVAHRHNGCQFISKPEVDGSGITIADEPGDLALSAFLYSGGLAAVVGMEHELRSICP